MLQNTQSTIKFAHQMKGSIPTAFGCAPGVKPWHGYKSTLSVEATKDYELALKETGLDYKVELQHSYLPGGVVNPNRFEVCRMNADGSIHTVLSTKTVSEDYKPAQNSHILSVLNQFVGVDMNIDSVGCMNEGELVFANVLTDGFDVEKGDEHKHFAQVVFGPDGKTAIKFFQTVVRMVCKNTVRHALEAAGSNVLKFRNLESGHMRMNDMASVVGLLEASRKTFAEKLQFLLSVKTSRKIEDEILMALFPNKVKDGKLIESEIFDAIYAQSADNGVGYVTGQSVYGFFNRLTAFTDSQAAAKSQKGLAGADFNTRMASQYASSMLGASADFKTSALQIALDVANKNR